MDMTRRVVALVAVLGLGVVAVIWIVNSPDPMATINAVGIAATAICGVALVASLAVDGRHFRGVNPGVFFPLAAVGLGTATQSLIGGREWLGVAGLLGAAAMVVVAFRARSSAAQPN